MQFNRNIAFLKKMKGESLMSEADKTAVWDTAIARVEPNKVAVRGYDIAEISRRRPRITRVSPQATSRRPAARGPLWPSRSRWPSLFCAVVARANPRWRSWHGVLWILMSRSAMASRR